MTPKLARTGWTCRLRELRKSLNLPMMVVAKRVGITISSLANIERALVIPTLDTAFRLSAFYGKPIEELWARKAVEEKPDRDDQPPIPGMEPT